MLAEPDLYTAYRRWSAVRDKVHRGARENKFLVLGSNGSSALADLQPESLMDGVDQEYLIFHLHSVSIRCF